MERPTACSACSSPTLRYACGACASYAFCSYECSDAVAEEHHAVCVGGGGEDIGASAEWKSYTPPELVHRTEAFLRKYASTKDKPKERWPLKREIRGILDALDAALAAASLRPNVRTQLEALRQQVQHL